MSIGSLDAHYTKSTRGKAVTGQSVIKLGITQLLPRATLGLSLVFVAAMVFGLI